MAMQAIINAGCVFGQITSLTMPKRAKTEYAASGECSTFRPPYLPFERKQSKTACGPVTKFTNRA